MSWKSIPLTPLDEIMARGYHSLVLCFELPPESESALVLKSLKKGLDRTVRALPFLAGEVTLRKGGEENGKLEIRRRLQPLVELKTKDLTKSGSGWNTSFRDLCERNIPVSFLEGRFFSPIHAQPEPNKPARVMMVQATLIEGGMLLVACFHHSAMDGAGAASVLTHWARFCELNVATVVDVGKVETTTIAKEIVDRQPLMRSPSMTQSKEHPEYRLRASKTPSVGTLPLSPPNMKLSIFHLPPESLRELKACVPQDKDQWTSTNDALSALLWSSITRARYPEPTLANRSDNAQGFHSKLFIAVNGRSRLSQPLPDDYIGNMTLSAITSSPLSEVSARPPDLEAIAIRIRHSITVIDEEYIRSAIALIDATPDVRDIEQNADYHCSRDLLITSWAAQPLLRTDWGPMLGGAPRYIRILKSEFDGICIVLPRLEDGGLEVVVGLEQAQMARLQVDEDFGRFATLRCA